MFFLHEINNTEVLYLALAHDFKFRPTSRSNTQDHHLYFETSTVLSTVAGRRSRPGTARKTLNSSSSSLWCSYIYQAQDSLIDCAALANIPAPWRRTAVCRCLFNTSTRLEFNREIVSIESCRIATENYKCHAPLRQLRLSWGLSVRAWCGVAAMSWRLLT
jgi:hypothetical protein